MKKSIFVFVLLLTIAILSCEKEHCWACTQTTVYEITGYLPDTNIVESVRCDLTEKTVDEMVRWLTYEATECQNGIIVNIHSSYHCMEATCW